MKILISRSSVLQSGKMSRVLKEILHPDRDRRFLVLAVALAFVWIGVRETCAGTNSYRIGIACNTNIFQKGELFDMARSQFEGITNIETIALAYGSPKQFCEVLSSNRTVDLILGPSDSESLKAFDALAPFATPLFLSSFVTTEPSSYKNIGDTLLLATPTDHDRIRLLKTELLDKICFNTAGVFHVDDPWGNEIVGNLNEIYKSGSIQVLSQSVREFDPKLNEEQRAGEIEDSSNQFLKKASERGVEVIVVAFHKESTINYFLKTLSKFKRSAIPYTPSIVLLNKYRFATEGGSEGIDMGYLSGFNIFSIMEIGAGSSPTTSGLSSFNDSCAVIKEAVSNTGNESSNQEITSSIAKFYRTGWSSVDHKQLVGQLTTGFHSRQAGGTSDSLQIYLNQRGPTQIAAVPLSTVFGSSWYYTLSKQGSFFLNHNRALVTPLPVFAFVLVSLAAFVYMVNKETLRKMTSVVKRAVFWKYFLVSLTINYALWAASLYTGTLVTNDFRKVFLVAVFCPSSFILIGEIVSKYLPIQVNLYKLFLDEVTSEMLFKIRTAAFGEYISALANHFATDDLRGFYRKLLYKYVRNPAKRERINSNLDKEIVQLQAEDKEEGEKELLAEFILLVVDSASHNTVQFHQILEQEGLMAAQTVAV